MEYMVLFEKYYEFFFFFCGEFKKNIVLLKQIFKVFKNINNMFIFKNEIVNIWW